MNPDKEKRNNETRPPRLQEVLGEYENANAARFHMPGHKGRGMGGFWRQELIKWDVTELSHMDDLHAPTDVLKRAQEACAALYGAEDTFFLVNGATAGVNAMLLSLGTEAKVLLSRDCHKSAISGAALAGLDCQFLLPAYDEIEGMWGMVTPEALEQALTEFPARAVLITSPNYYGMCANIETLAEIAHRHDAMLFVDASHGAHFVFGKTLPQSPANSADLWVNSAHKTLNALGQAALLHRGRGCPIPAEDIRRALTLVETSSPSYLIMASLDWACYTAAVRQDWDAHSRFCQDWGAKLSSLPGLRVLGRDCVGGLGIWDKDPTRLVIDVTSRGITGYQGAQSLEKANVYVEMADMRRLVLICTPSDDPNWYSMLYEALQAMPYGRRVPGREPHFFALPPREMPLRQAALGAVRQVPFAQAAGHIAAQAAGIYPPGIALVTPGERILEESILILQEHRAMGGTLFGVNEGGMTVVRE